MTRGVRALQKKYQEKLKEWASSIDSRAYSGNDAKFLFGNSESFSVILSNAEGHDIFSSQIDGFIENNSLIVYPKVSKGYIDFCEKELLLLCIEYLIEIMKLKKIPKIKIGRNGTAKTGRGKKATSYETGWYFKDIDLFFAMGFILIGEGRESYEKGKEENKKTVGGSRSYLYGKDILELDVFNYRSPKFIATTVFDTVETVKKENPALRLVSNKYDMESIVTFTLSFSQTYTVFLKRKNGNITFIWDEREFIVIEDELNATTREIIEEIIMSQRLSYLINPPIVGLRKILNENIFDDEILKEAVLLLIHEGIDCLEFENQLELRRRGLSSEVKIKHFGTLQESMLLKIRDVYLVMINFGSIVEKSVCKDMDEVKDFIKTCTKRAEEEIFLEVEKINN